MFTSSQEKEFRKCKLSEITEKSIIGLPLLIKVDDYAYTAITEADLTNWAGLYLTKDIEKKKYSITSTLSPIPGSSGEDADKPLSIQAS